jgi:hypothetical protein
MTAKLFDCHFVGPDGFPVFSLRMEIPKILLDSLVNADPTAFRLGVDGRLRNDPPFPIPEPPLLFGKLVQSDEWVFANQHKLLFAAVRPEA